MRIKRRLIRWWRKTKRFNYRFVKAFLKFIAEVTSHEKHTAHHTTVHHKKYVPHPKPTATEMLHHIRHTAAQGITPHHHGTATQSRWATHKH